MWRVARGPDPLATPAVRAADLTDTTTGNRFDSLTGQYSVLYFGTTLEVCFGETLSRFRKDPRLAFIDDDPDWERLFFMKRGTVPRDWRDRRIAVRATVPDPARFFNVENAKNRAHLQSELGSTLSFFGVDELDVSVIRGHDRRVTRLISQWVWGQSDVDGHPLFAGIRYLSRVNTAWECWAVFDDAEFVELERQPILKETEGLSEVEQLYQIVVF